MFRKLVSLLIAVSFLLIGTAAFTVSAEQQLSPAPAVTQPIIKLLPDLVVVNATATWIDKQNQTFRISVKNQGNLMAGPFRILIEYGYKYEDGKIKLHDYPAIIDANGIGAGATGTFSKDVFNIVINLGPAGCTGCGRKEVFIEQVRVDSHNQVAESNEDNNGWPRRQ